MDKEVKISFIFLLILLIACFLLPSFIDYGEYEIFYDESGTRVLSMENRSLAHLLGTDKKGQDVFIRLLYGGRLSLLLAFAAVILQSVIGIGVGLLAGYKGKRTDMILMRITDVFNALPDLVIILILSSVMVAYGIGGKDRILMLMLFLAGFGWTFVAKIVRSQTLYIRESAFMMAAELCGISTLRRLTLHLLPNVMGQVLAVIPVSIGNIILTEATLSFLGFGLPYPYASWGNMLTAAMDTNILANHPHIWVPPGLLIFSTVAAFHILGKGLKNRRWGE
ncbi:MAG: ABC transporter permease [Eubacteriales bacterium]|nr:ABC transporter permease [Eubacteriales bacterium]MDD4583548.1 ABC transporter permease [Eubacteriales bacterium]